MNGPAAMGRTPERQTLGVSLPSVARLLTPDDVATYLCVPVSWVREHSSGKRRPQLPGFKVGKYWRYRQDEVDRWLKVPIKDLDAA